MDEHISKKEGTIISMINVSYEIQTLVGGNSDGQELKDHALLQQGMQGLTVMEG